VFRETTSQAVHEQGGPWRGSRAFGIPVGSTGTALFRGQPVDAETLVTLGGDDELDFYTPRGFDILGLVVDADAFASHADTVEHRDAVAFFGGRSTLKPDPERMSALRSLLLSVLESLDANPGVLQYRQTQRVLAQSLMSAAMAAVPDNGAANKGPCPSRQHIVDAAQAIMRARITEPITVADLCVALGVSRRTLQYSFQEVLGLNPVRFLRAMRLNGVRRDLKQTTAPAATVQDTAATWGFWHLGHFVTDYKRMFGELPSETLRRRRGRAASARA
jgi:AraC family ethanolamine operon transcriptional activator